MYIWVVFIDMPLVKLAIQDDGLVCELWRFPMWRAMHGCSKNSSTVNRTDESTINMLRRRSCAALEMKLKPTTRLGTWNKRLSMLVWAATSSVTPPYKARWRGGTRKEGWTWCTPALQTSASPPYACRVTSYAIYGGVPTSSCKTSSGWVKVESLKSMILIIGKLLSSLSTIKTFSGLRSRCTTPTDWHVRMALMI